MLKSSLQEYDTFKIIIASMPPEPEIKEHNFYEDYLQEKKKYEDGLREQQPPLVTEKSFDMQQVPLGSPPQNTRHLYISSFNLANYNDIEGDVPEESIPNKPLPGHFTVVRNPKQQPMSEGLNSSLPGTHSLFANDTKVGLSLPDSTKIMNPDEYSSYQEYLIAYEKERSYLKHLIFQLQRDLEVCLANRRTSTTSVGNSINLINSKVAFTNPSSRLSSEESKATNLQTSIKLKQKYTTFAKKTFQPTSRIKSGKSTEKPRPGYTRS